MGHRLYSTILTILLIASAFIYNISLTETTGEMTTEDLAKILVDGLKNHNLYYPHEIYGDINALPGYPSVSFKIVDQFLKNNTPVYIISEIRNYGKVLASYQSLSGEPKDLRDVLDIVFGTQYNTALETFYYVVPSMGTGVPSGYYDVIKPPGLKQVDIPPTTEIRVRIKPVLLAVFIGYSDGRVVKNPIYIYYFGFETTGTTYDGVFTRLTIVLAIVFDETNTLYRTGNEAGLVFYHSAAAVAPLGGSFPITALYGFLGILAALIVVFIEFDEDYKYYLTLFILFVIQIFLYVVLNTVAGISLDVLYGVPIAMGPWFIVLFLLWVAPYIFASYLYNSSKETFSPPSGAMAVLEGLFMAFLIMLLALSMVFTRAVVEFLVATSGPGGVYALIVYLILFDIYVGTSLGKLWATFTRFRETLPTHTYFR